ncbi:MAG: hypothetical protein ACLT4C_03675 [Butyricicoccus sp.]
MPKDVNAMVRPKPAFAFRSKWGFPQDHLPKWKDRLPQFNPEFDKRHQIRRDTAYSTVLFITCRAEVSGDRRARLGIARFCLLSADGRRGSSGMRSLLAIQWRTPSRIQRYSETAAQRPRLSLRRI